VVGEKKARELWSLNKRYSGAEAVAMGLANVCVPHEQLDATVQEGAETICERSPTAIAIAKRSFSCDTAHQSGIAGMGMYALKLYDDTEESREGVNALKDKRKPDFKKYAKSASSRGPRDASESVHRRRPADAGRQRAPLCRRARGTRLPGARQVA